MPSIETKPDTSRDRALEEPATPALGHAIASGEEKALDLGTNRIYPLRLRHPYLYGVTAFILGGGLISIFVMTTYTNWAYEGVNLTTAVYQIVFGGLGGGLVAVILAFAYAASVKSTGAPMRSLPSANPRYNSLPAGNRLGVD